jgi:hypothetical protein
MKESTPIEHVVVPRTTEFKISAAGDLTIRDIYAAPAGRVGNIVVLRGGMGRKQRREVNERLVAIRDSEPRLILRSASRSARASMMPAWTPCFSRCQFPGRERSSNTSAASIGFTTARRRDVRLR